MSTVQAIFVSSLWLQAGALVQIYTDGTVLVTHGGVEMGQGLHTKVAQIAASCFNIPLSSVFISETSTDKVCIHFGRDFFFVVLVYTIAVYKEL